ncbi:MAG: exported protein of unknown function [Ramlibacter sp.]|nr:exported protein of unknown function [Ramlibacter sp.]
MTRIGLLVAVALMFAAPVSRAADPADGVYTPAQAQQGRALYGANCAACHGAALQGGAGPALAGDHFRATWGTRTLASLVAFEHSQMPPGKPGSVPEPDDLAITAFILQMNDAPAGTRALAAGSPLLGRRVTDALGEQASAPTAAATPAPRNRS